MKNVMFYSACPSPYRTDFYNKLSKHCNLTVLYEIDSKAQVERNEKWFENKDNYKNLYLKTNNIFKNIKYTIDEFKKSNADKLVLCQYASINAMLFILYLKFKGISYCFEIDGGIAKKDNFINKLLKTFFISCANKYMSPSKEADKYLLHYGAKEKDIFRYNFSSIVEKDLLVKPLNKEEKKEIKQSLGIKEDKVVLFVGNFIKRKGIDILIDLFNGVEDFGVYIVGGGELKEEISLKIKDKKNIKIVDFVKKDILKKYYDMADLFIFPTREDIWGLVINEAMAHALPVITSDNCVAGLSLIKDGINGYVVNNEDKDRYLSCINKILKDDVLAKQMAENNLSLIRNYTIENMVERHIEILGL